MGVSSYVVKKEAVIMGRIDAETKEYVKRPEVFADLFNHLLYDGKPVIEPGKLYRECIGMTGLYRSLHL